VVLLYQPYLRLSWVDLSSPFQNAIDPLQRMKEASQAVESSVIDLISGKKTDALPNWLVSWVTLPVAVYYVNQHVTPNPGPDRVLMPFLNRFMRRTTGAQFLFLALTKALKDFLKELNDGAQGSKNAAQGSKRKIAPSTAQHVEGVIAAWNARNRIVEARMLAHVTQALDHTLELQC